MQIEVQIMIDGTPARVNEELQTIVENLVGSYIKQKFIMGRPDKPIKPPKDPNAPKRPTRKRFNEEETAVMMVRATELAPTTTMGKTVTIISQEMKRSPNAIYLRLRELAREGKITFKTPFYNV